MGHIRILRSSINAPGPVPVWQQKCWAQSFLAVLAILIEWSSFWHRLMFSSWFPSRHSHPRRWTRPAPSLLLQPSSPRTSCWPSSPKRSWCWRVESMGSWQVQVIISLIKLNKLSLVPVSSLTGADGHDFALFPCAILDIPHTSSNCSQIVFTCCWGSDLILKGSRAKQVYNRYLKQP